MLPLVVLGAPAAVLLAVRRRRAGLLLAVALAAALAGGTAALVRALHDALGDAVQDGVSVDRLRSVMESGAREVALATGAARQARLLGPIVPAYADG